MFATWRLFSIDDTLKKIHRELWELNRARKSEQIHRELRDSSRAGKSERSDAAPVSSISPSGGPIPADFAPPRDIVFECSNCQYEIAASKEMAGLDGKCPQCKSAFVFPSDGSGRRESSGGESSGDTDTACW